MSKQNKIYNLFEKKGSPSFYSKNRENIQYGFIVSIFVIIILFCLYFISDYSNVGEVIVSGNQEVTDQEVLEISPISTNDSVWTVQFNRDEISKYIVNEHPQIEEVFIERHDGNDFRITIEETLTVGYLEGENNYYKILQSGEVLKQPYSVSLGNKPVFINFEENDTLMRLVEEFNELATAVTQLISELEYSPNEANENRVTLYMNDGNQVIASIPSLSERMNYYTAMLEAVEGQTGVFNLETGAYFTPYSTISEADERNTIESQEN